MVEKNAPDRLVMALEIYSDFSIIENIEKIIVAGGFIRAYYAGEKPSDLDLYFRSNIDLVSVKLELQGKNWVEISKTDKDITLKKDNKLIQLISYIYGEPLDVIQLFDFTICCASMTITRQKVGILTDFGEAKAKLRGHLILHDDFFEHLSGRVLEFIGTPLPISSLARAFKFVKRGYSICDDSIVKVAEAVFRQVNFDEPNKLIEHLKGIGNNKREIIGMSAMDID